MIRGHYVTKTIKKNVMNYLKEPSNILWVSIVIITGVCIYLFSIRPLG